MNVDPKHTAKVSQEFLKTKKWDIPQWTRQSYDPNPTEDRETHNQAVTERGGSKGLEEHPKKLSTEFGEVDKF